jgi:dipeptidyl aminopeptidase/acylaminoacyl peptidase
MENLMNLPKHLFARTHRSAGRAIPLLFGVLLLAAGCARTSSPATGAASLPAGDRAVVSVQKLTRYSTPGATLYRVYYKADGQKVEAYLTVPDRHSPYPLLVNLHGGGGWESVLQHYTPYTYTAQGAAEGASSKFAVLYPEYQGFRGSSGYVGGLHADALDTIAGVRAAEAIGRINPHALYLIGYSVGGGVALKVAGMMSGIRAVIGVSPYVGLRIYLPWLAAHAQPGTFFFHEMNLFIGSYGVHPSPEVLGQQSPNLAAITAPVLLLQGTADQTAAWQPTQELYTQMKAAGKTVKLILYPGGQHGLRGADQTASNRAIQQWFQHYGLASNY